MPILNYTTSISAAKTVGEIQQMLAKAGCNKIVMDFEDGEPAALTFMVAAFHRQLYFALPARVEGCPKAMQRDKKAPRSLCTMVQARRVAWRIIKDWCAAQLAFIESGRPNWPKCSCPMPWPATGKRFTRTWPAGA